MKNTNKPTPRLKAVPHAQKLLIRLYVLALGALAVSITLMPTQLLVLKLPKGSIYGHSILFWLSLLAVLLCFRRFKKNNASFQANPSQRLPDKSFRLFRSPESRLLAYLCLCACILFVLLSCFLKSALPRFILFAVCVFLLGLYLGRNSYEYQIYRIALQSHERNFPCKSQIRRDENEKNHPT